MVDGDPDADVDALDDTDETAVVDALFEAEELGVEDTVELPVTLPVVLMLDD